MRLFSILAGFGIVALASAQVTAHNSTSTAVSTATSESSAPAVTSLSPQARCLQKCGSADVCCQAACVNVPCPSQLQANATTECAAQCPQGNGTAADTQKYAACQSRCISSLFFSSGTPATATAAGSGSAASATADSTGIGDGSTTKSATGSAASATHTGNGADNLRIVSGAGLLGLIIAGLAL